MKSVIRYFHVVLFFGLLVVSSFAEHPQILDNTASNIWTQGVWTVSGSTKGYIGENYYYILSDGGNDQFKWPTINAEGLHHVYAKWTAHANRSSSVEYEIRTPISTNSITVNQQLNGDRWNYLGTVDFSTNSVSAQSVRVYESTSGYVVADAILLLPAKMILSDNEDIDAEARAGSWLSSSGVGGYYGSNYQYNYSGGESDWFRWPSANVSGDYLVFANWTEHANRTSSAHYKIFHKTGSADLYMDQRSNGAWWNLLGTFEFDGGSDESVHLYGPSSGYVIADAVCKVEKAVDHPPFDLSGWNLTFNDEFNGTSLNANTWESQASDSDHILSSRWPENNVVSGGYLRQMIWYDTTKVEGKEWTSAHIWSKNFTQKYGYFEASIKYVDETGVNNAFWLFDPWELGNPSKSEIDINEGQRRTDLHLTYHDHKTPVGANHFYTAQTYEQLEDLSADFHLYAMEWDDTRIIWYFDHQVIRVWEHGGMTSEELDVRFSVAVVDWGSAGPVNTNELHNKYMVVDYVNVYEKE